MVRSRARDDHHRPAPLPSLKRIGRPNQQLRLRRSPAQLQLRCIVVAIAPVVGGRRGGDGPSQAKDVFGLDGEWCTSH
eukprot:844527-Pyramimonas_sp.AAC.1